MNTVATSPAHTDVSDNVLFQRFQAGEQEAFAALVSRYQRELFGYLARFTGDAMLADDIFQETFLQVYQSAALFDSDRPFRPWLYTVASNKARDALRKVGRHTTAPLDAVVPGNAGRDGTYADVMPANIPTPDEALMNLQTRQAVQSMVKEMPDGLREVLILSYFQELPHKDIAETLSIPVGTVKSRLHNAVRLFAEKWKIYAAKQSNITADSPQANPSEGMN